MTYPDDFINKVICGDCLEVMKHIPDGAVDLVLTDPPYGIGEIRSGSVSKKRLHKTKYSSFTDSPEYVKAVCTKAVEYCVDKYKNLIVTTGWKCLRMYPQWDGFGCFYSPATCGMQLWGRGDSQPILYYGKPFDLGKAIKPCSYKLTEKPSCPKHPCSKPIKAWMKIIADRTQPNDLILDPFLGSGTTAVACKQLGRRFIGIEINPDYCKIAEDRLRQEELF